MDETLPEEDTIETLAGGDLFEELVVLRLDVMPFLDPAFLIRRHLGDDWNTQDIDTSQPSYRFAFRSSEGSGLFGTVGGRETDVSVTQSTSVNFRSPSSDLLAYTSSRNERENDVSVGFSRSDTFQVFAGAGTRDRSDNISFTQTSTSSSAETIQGIVTASSGHLRYRDGHGGSFRIKFSNSLKENESGVSIGRNSATVTYADADGNRIEIAASSSFSLGGSTDTFALRIDRLKVFESGDLVIDTGRIRLDEQPVVNIFEDLEQALLGSGDETPIFGTPQDVFVSLAGVALDLASALDF